MLNASCESFHSTAYWFHLEQSHQDAGIGHNNKSKGAHKICHCKHCRLFERSVNLGYYWLRNRNFSQKIHWKKIAEIKLTTTTYHTMVSQAYGLGESLISCTAAQTTKSVVFLFFLQKTYKKASFCIIVDICCWVFGVLDFLNPTPCSHCAIYGTLHAMYGALSLTCIDSGIESVSL